MAEVINAIFSEDAINTASSEDDLNVIIDNYVEKPDTLITFSDDTVNVKLSEDIINVTIDNYVKGPCTFITLNDTPSDYTGQAEKFLLVNTTEDGLSFVTPFAESVITKIEAKENLPIYTVVTIDGYIADSTDITQINKILGITTEATNTGLACKILTFGYIQNLNWNFLQETKLFLNGTMIDVIPSNIGFVQEIGSVFNVNTLYFNLQRSILI